MLSLIHISFARLYNMDGVEEKLDAFLKQEGPGLMECVIDQYDLVK